MNLIRSFAFGSKRNEPKKTASALPVGTIGQARLFSAERPSVKLPTFALSGCYFGWTFFQPRTIRVRHRAVLPEIINLVQSRSLAMLTHHSVFATIVTLRSRTMLENIQLNDYR